MITTERNFSNFEVAYNAGLDAGYEVGYISDVFNAEHGLVTLTDIEIYL